MHVYTTPWMMIIWTKSSYLKKKTRYSRTVMETIDLAPDRMPEAQINTHLQILS